MERAELAARLRALRPELGTLLRLLGEPRPASRHSAGTGRSSRHTLRWAGGQAGPEEGSSGGPEVRPGHRRAAQGADSRETGNGSMAGTEPRDWDKMQDGFRVKG